MRMQGMDRQTTAGVDKPKRSRRKPSLHTIKQVARIFAPFKLQIILVLLSIIATTLLGLLPPFIISQVFDKAIGQRNAKLLVILISILVIIPLITSLISVGEAYLNNVLSQRVMRDLRNQLYRHMQRMSLRFFTSTHTGEIQSRLSNDINGVQNVVTNTARGVVANISTVLSTIIAMLVLSPLLTVISLGLLPFFLWVTYKIGHVRHSTSKETQESLASLSVLMQETLSVGGILLNKTFGREQYAQTRFENENQRLTDLQVRQQMIGQWFLMLMNGIFSMAPAMVYLIGGLQIIANPANPVMTIGKIVAFTTLQNRLFFPVGQLFNIQVDIFGTLALFDRIFEYLELPVEIQNIPNALYLKPEEIRGEITFENVCFTYQPARQTESENTPLSLSAEAAQKSHLHRVIFEPTTNLKHVSFEIKPGQLAALVGPSGAGKTTLTYLVPRLYDVENGVVKIDGINVKDIALESLAELVGMVTQETYLFHASIRENLLYVRENATEQEMIAAARAAAIHNRIMEMDRGYDTIVGERGYRLSGGEKQRIAIARVILKDPRILILDEATSSLDTRSEHLIQMALEPLMKQRTTLAIAHRLSTILTADVIFVVNQGQIVEHGTHRELLARQGFYAQLYYEQFASGPGAAPTPSDSRG